MSRQGYGGQRPKKVSPAKVTRAIEALDALLICADLEDHMPAADRAYLVAAKRGLHNMEDESG